MAVEQKTIESFDSFLETIVHSGIVVSEEMADERQRDVDAILAQYGILGMKWGRRRNSDGSVTITPHKEAGKREASSSKAESPRAKAKAMTNEELNTVIKRLQLEQQYAQLTAPKKGPVKKFVTDVLVNAGKQQATAYVSAYMGAGIGLALQKAKVPNAKALAEMAKKTAEAVAEDKKD